MPRKTPKPTMAERLRAHREAFELALDEGITPAEAEAIIARRAAIARWTETERRLAAMQQRPLRAAIAPTPEPTTPRAWWHD